jgi:hypothetical protein
VNRNFFENRPQTVLFENGSRAVALMNIVVDYQYLSDKTFSLMEIMGLGLPHEKVTPYLELECWNAGIVESWVVAYGSERAMTSYYYFIQYFLSVAPIRLAACQKRIKGLGMIMVFQVAKLMHDNVLDAMDGRFYQV